ncbi:MAG: SPOR domain-containing protein [Candidatus Omnitrophota bacterium]
MEKINHTQLELFSQGEGKVSVSGQKKRFQFTIRGYERVILIALGFTVTGIIGFCAGVEKGKSLAKIPAAPVMQDTAAREAVPKPQSTQPAPRKTEATSEQYTIQLVSYQSKVSALKELDTLKKKGFSGKVIPKGKYTILCVGNFSDKETALALLSEFQRQTRYKGCFVRRL